MDEVILTRIRQEAYEQGYQDGKVDGYNLAGTRMSSAKQERKKGKWTEKEVIHAEEAKEVITEWQSCRCSVCGRYHTQPYMYYFENPNYCDFCGAKMD